MISIDTRLVVCMDTETTGLGYDAEICQLAIIDHQEKTLLYELIKPYGKISPEAMAVHGITEQIVRNKKPIDYYWPYLMGNLLSGKIVIGYNVMYDVRMLMQSSAIASRMGHLDLKKSLSPLMIIDVMEFFKQFRKLQKWCNLTEAVARESINHEDLTSFHDAMFDATVTLRIFKSLVEE